MTNKQDKKINLMAYSLSSIYATDPTLEAIMKLEEDRQKLLKETIDQYSATDVFTDLQKTLSNLSIQDAFKTYSDYESYANPILAANDYMSVAQAIQQSYESALSNNYKKAMKASEILSSSIHNIPEVITVDKIDPYITKISEVANSFKENNDLLEMSKDLLGVAATIDNDTFKSQFETLADYDISPKIPDYDFPHVEIPRIEDSPIYQQTEKLVNQSNAQISLLEKMSKYMASQQENLELQNDITRQQIKGNKRSSNIAIVIAISSIVLSIGISSIIYFAESNSDQKLHSAMKKTVESNNNKNELNKLIITLKEQNTELQTSNNLLKQQLEYWQKAERNNDKKK